VRKIPSPTTSWSQILLVVYTYRKRERERFAREGERERLRTKERAIFSENLTDSSEENRLQFGWVAICFTDQEEDIPSVVATTTTKPFAAVVDHSWHIKYL
jgi:hypothetical protein